MVVRGKVWGKHAAWLTAAAVMAVWQAVSTVVPSYLVPGLPAIGKQLLHIAVNAKELVDALSTFGRIFGGLVPSFAVGSVLGIAMGLSDPMRRYITPFITFVQGIPALSWVVIAIIWFKQVEVRVLFILVMSSMPNFAFQVLDSVRAIPKDLWEMVNAMRPRRGQLLTKLVFPAVVPGMLTGWKINLGNATRVVIVAEMVGATTGVGFQLSNAQQLFNMPGAIAWTLTLVVFVLITKAVIETIETGLLRWRPRLER